jgi:hypothetical protein
VIFFVESVAQGYIIATIYLSQALSERERGRSENPRR